MTKEQKEALLSKIANAATSGFTSEIKRLIDQGNFQSLDAEQCAKDIAKSTDKSVWEAVLSLTEGEARELLHNFVTELSMKQMKQQMVEFLEKHKEHDPDGGFAC